MRSAVSLAFRPIASNFVECRREDGRDARLSFREAAAGFRGFRFRQAVGGRRFVGRQPMRGQRLFEAELPILQTGRRLSVHTDETDALVAEPDQMADSLKRPSGMLGADAVLSTPRKYRSITTIGKRFNVSLSTSSL